MAHPFKVQLTDEAARALAAYVSTLQAEENNYQIGVATIAARVLEVLAMRPELLQDLLQQSRKRQATVGRAEIEYPHQVPKKARKRRG